MAKWQIGSIGGGICSMVIPHYIEHHPHVNLALLCLGIILVAVPILLWAIEKAFGYHFVNPFQRIDSKYFRGTQFNSITKVSSPSKDFAENLTNRDVEFLLDGEIQGEYFIYKEPKLIKTILFRGNSIKNRYTQQISLGVHTKVMSEHIIENISMKIRLSIRNYDDAPFSIRLNDITEMRYNTISHL